MDRPRYERRQFLLERKFIFERRIFLDGGSGGSSFSSGSSFSGGSSFSSGGSSSGSMLGSNSGDNSANGTGTGAGTNSTSGLNSGRDDCRRKFEPGAQSQLKSDFRRRGHHRVLARERKAVDSDLQEEESLQRVGVPLQPSAGSEDSGRREYGDASATGSGTTAPGVGGKHLPSEARPDRRALRPAAVSPTSPMIANCAPTVNGFRNAKGLFPHGNTPFAISFDSSAVRLRR